MQYRISSSVTFWVEKEGGETENREADREIKGLSQWGGARGRETARVIEVNRHIERQKARGTKKETERGE